MATTTFIRVFEQGVTTDANGAALEGAQFYDLFGTPANTDTPFTLEAWLAAEGAAGHVLASVRANSSNGRTRLTVTTQTTGSGPNAGQAVVKVWVERGTGESGPNGTPPEDTGFTPQMSSVCFVLVGTEFTDPPVTAVPTNLFDYLAYLDTHTQRLLDTQTIAAESKTVIVTVVGPGLS